MEQEQEVMEQEVMEPIPKRVRIKRVKTKRQDMTEAKRAQLRERMRVIREITKGVRRPLTAKEKKYMHQREQAVMNK